jgi:hypothetical protein
MFTRCCRHAACANEMQRVLEWCTYARCSMPFGQKRARPAPKLIATVRNVNGLISLQRKCGTARHPTQCDLQHTTRSATNNTTHSVQSYNMQHTIPHTTCRSCAVPTCSMQHTIQHATHSMQQCSIRHAACMQHSIQHTTCSIQCVAYNMQHTTCSIQHAAYNVQHTI